MKTLLTGGEDIGKWIDAFEDLDPSYGEPKIGPCTPDHYWWDDECWYTDDEKDAMAANAWWIKRVGYLKPVDQTKVEWASRYTPNEDEK